MIRQVAVASLKPGMFIHRLNCDWRSHPFFRPRFLIETEAEIARLREAGIHEVCIDTGRGLDIAEAPAGQEMAQPMPAGMPHAAAAPVVQRVALDEELPRAREVHRLAHRVVRDTLQDVRLGRAVELDRLEPVVEAITGSILRNDDALLGMLNLKTADEYTFLHCVSVCTFMVAFCRAAGFDEETTRQAGLGGLVHDIGKMKTPGEVLNKPGRLTEAEFAVIRRHPEEGHRMLLATPGIGEAPLAITLEHHERMDGSGYPGRLPGGRIHPLAKMAAIVDVYDAITSDRVYHKGMPPTAALAKLYEWSGLHFDPVLTQQFMRCIGIYPAGTLVRLESGRLGVVIEQNHANLLTPTVRVFFSAASNTCLTPETIDLSCSQDRIMQHEDPGRWGLDPQRFLQAQ